LVEALRFFLFLLLAASCATSHAGMLTGKVIGISDGDSITVLDARKIRHEVRLLGIDAPERRQPFGRRSTESLSRLVFGKEVDVIWDKRDHYERILGVVMVAEPSCVTRPCPKTLDAGLEQIKVGMAWWYKQYAKDQRAGNAERYRKAEEDARRQRLGLWRGGKPVPPWEWRKKYI